MFSIYIPNMRIETDLRLVSEVMSDYGIGEVSCVDFVQPHKKPGFKETDVFDKSAFVYFTNRPLANGKYNNDFWNTISQCKRPYHRPYSIWVNSTKDMWLCMKNMNPVRRTMMNIHQVVENCRYLESLIENQADLESLVENQAKQIKAMSSAIKNLEKDIKERKMQTADNNCSEDTTGYALKRTTRVERGIPHPSLPEHPFSSLPDSIRERIKFSFELCGNN
jgi:hypothetical protein